jgi:MerC mercury resistance protein
MVRESSAISTSFSRVNWDAVGVITSSVCVIHCVLFPIVLAFAPTLAHFLPGSETIHRTLAYILAAVGLVAFWAGYKVHRRKLVLLLLAIGILGVTVGAYADFLLRTHIWEVMVTMAGSFFLIAAHSLNRTLCRSCRICADNRGANDVPMKFIEETSHEE